MIEGESLVVRPPIRRTHKATSLLTASVLAIAGVAFAAEPGNRRTLSLPTHVSSLAFSPDGKLLATVSDDGKIMLWDTATAQPSGPALEGGYRFKTGFWHGHSGGELAFSPDGANLAWRRDDKVVVWDVATRLPIGRPAGRPIAFSPDSKALLLNGQDGLLLWSVSKRELIGPPIKHEHRFSALFEAAFSPDGQLLAMVNGDGIVFWDVAKGAPLGPSLKHRDLLRPGLGVALVFSPDGGTLATYSQANGASVINLYDIASLMRSGHGRRG